MAIRTCHFCNAVHDANDFDEDWVANGCPECPMNERLEELALGYETQ